MTDGFEKTAQHIQVFEAGEIAERMAIPYNELERIAFHEAGHAILMRHYGQPIARIEIGAGGCVYPVESEESLTTALQNSATDSDNTAHCAECLTVCGQPPDLDELRQRAQTILSENWPLVCRVARALVARRRLGGDDFAELCEPRWWEVRDVAAR